MYNEKQKVLIILSSLELCSASKMHAFLKGFSSVEELWYDTKERRAKMAAFFTPMQCEKLSFALSDVYFDVFYDQLCKKEVSAVCLDDDAYPETLKNIYDPPLTLFCKGDVSLLKEECLAIVGSRKCTSYGRRVTEWFSSELCKQFCIVSGLATGIDSTAHRRTLDCGGKTIAVLAGGFDCIYPAHNAGLAEEIANKGLLVCEFKPSAEPVQYRFPMRNRLISGLSMGVLVAEAGEKSGVFSTLESAAEQGRDAFVVPGDIFSYASKGSNNLIKNYRNIMVTSPEDIKEFYGVKYTIGQPKRKRPIGYQPDLTEQKVIEAFGAENTMHFDDLVKNSGLAAAEVNFSLTNLELNDIVCKINNNNFQLKTEADK